MKEPTTYELRTLADIFNLPSAEHIERCMNEVRDGMILAKETKEFVEGIENKDCGFIWPEVSHWCDDGKDEQTVKVTDPTGQGFTIKVGKDE